MTDVLQMLFRTDRGALEDELVVVTNFRGIMVRVCSTFYVLRSTLYVRFRHSTCQKERRRHADD
jgi:hypothetical protein